MSTYLIRRVLQAALAVVGAVIVMFFLLRLTGDPAQLMVAPDAPASDVERVRHAMGFDRPLPVQRQNLLLARQAPFGWPGGSLAYPVGTDGLGRDIMTRVIYGARVSLAVGFGSVAIAGSVGVLLGLVAGDRGGWWDDVIMRLGDIQLAFPALVLAIALMAVLGAGLTNVILVLALTNWVTYARVVGDWLRDVLDPRLRRL